MEEQLRGPRHSRLSRIDCRDAGAARRRDAVKAAAPSKHRGSPEFTCAHPAHARCLLVCGNRRRSIRGKVPARFPRAFLVSLRVRGVTLFRQAD